MYILPESVRIAQDSLVQHLAPFVYHSSNKTPALWTNISHPINFTLVVDDFWVKYSVKEHYLHLKAVLEDKYKVNTDWEGQLCIKI